MQIYSTFYCKISSPKAPFFRPDFSGEAKFLAKQASLATEILPDFCTCRGTFGVSFGPCREGSNSGLNFPVPAAISYQKNKQKNHETLRR